MTLEFTAISNRTSHFKLTKKVFKRLKNTLEHLLNYLLHSFTLLTLTLYYSFEPMHYDFVANNHALLL